ncbi:uncharacterized protein MYCFIDRAFT_189819 [Pseudocercospora fijiensis CIRAD86]|uniref:Enoyl reductase (ER) domain-containing protein n=1 Tax=Pseudocercospora fijiensis (strain CIRAD86) TaxID=383855 RepID=M3A6F3_PSEFD|nr:uncharacterized protein MYCFIDRAFT_189819 [Pseudocercospora fijiensis CIRAD86]EME80181.1 hypothetical protein MYCFIDRAFT_189819 [Pseudocercospora fijiensis CIRAD86]
MTEYTVPCRGIVAYSEHEWKLEDLLTREPREDEFLVEMIATGICHTDIAGYGGIYPRVLGHEGAGRITKLGNNKQSSKFQVGDLVILSAAACLNCMYCSTGHPAYCVEHAQLTSGANEPNFVLASDKSKVIGGGFFGQSSFASPVRVKVSAASNVTSTIKDAEELKLYAPLGCGITTGAGAITHVIGLAGVGLAGISAAKHLGAKTILAIDLNPSRIELAKSLGATLTLNSSPDSLSQSGHSLIEAIRSLTPGSLGCTHILDTTPSVSILSQALECLQKNGQLLQVGLKPVGAVLELDGLKHMANGRQLKGVIAGDRDPSKAIPELIREFKRAVEGMESGRVVKSVLIW